MSQRQIAHRLSPLLASIITAVMVLVLTPTADAGGRQAKTDIRSRSFALTTTVLPHDVDGKGFANFGEPTVALSTKGTLFICGPGGLLGGNNRLLRSADWVHFVDKTYNDPGAGGDCDLKPAPDGSLYAANLQGFGSVIRKSVDDGETWTYQTTEEPIEEDRQWLAPDPVDGSIVYFGYHDLAAEAEIVAKSLDGGKTFPIHSIASTDPTLAADTYPNTYSGPVRVDPSNHNRVYITYAISSAQSNVTQDSRPFGLPEKIVVASSADGGLTWTDHVVMSGPPGSVVGNLFPWMTIDKAGNLYSIAAGHIGPDATSNGLYVASSTDHGATWSPPMKINVGAGSTVFPTAVAGKDGVLDVAWLEDSLTDFSDPKSQWSLHFAQSRNAHDAAPTYKEVVGPVVRNGAVCVLGILCNGNRNLADFFEIALDNFGYAHMAVASTVGSTLQADGGESSSNLHIVYWRQDAGPSAYSEPCVKRDSPSCVTVRPFPAA